MVYPISKRIVCPIIRLFLKKAEGIENIPKKGPFIIASNHQSYLDAFLIASVIVPLKNEKIHFLANKGPFWHFFGDKVARDWAGCIPLDKEKEKALQELSFLLKKGKIVGIFIEGPLGINAKVRRPKKGVVRLALKSHAPILPIGIVGTGKIAPKGKIIPNPKRAEIRIGKAIYLKEYYKQDITKKLLRKLTDKIMHNILQLKKPYDTNK